MDTTDTCEGFDNLPSEKEAVARRAEEFREALLLGSMISAKEEYAELRQRLGRLMEDIHEIESQMQELEESHPFVDFD